ncbi:MAG: hypothetical protein AB8G15_08285 [Saprospiraceae bacterium]
MKKTKFLLLCFVAFFIMGLQSVNAQTSLNLVDETVAVTLLDQEMNSIHDNISNYSEKQVQHQTLTRKLNFYVAVYEQIVSGSDVDQAIQSNYSKLLIGGTASGFAKATIDTKDSNQNDQLYQDLLNLLQD